MNKQQKNSIVLIALLLAAVLCLTACAAKEAPKSQESAAGFTPKLDPKMESSITVAGSYNNFEALETEFNRFAEYYPNVIMKYTYLDNYNGIIATALNSTEAPDIFFSYPWMASGEEYASVY